MNVLIVAVCMNIAIVNAKYAVIDLDTILNLVQKRHENSGSKETNEPVETLPIMPGFYMVKPDGITNSEFKYPRNFQKVYSNKKKENVSPKEPAKLVKKLVKKLVTNLATSDSVSKDLILQIFKDVFHGDPKSRDRYDTTRDKVNITKQFFPITPFKNKELLAKIMDDIKKTHDSRGNYKYATVSNQGDIPEEYIPNTGFKNKDVLSKVMMEAVKNLHKNRASEKDATAKKKDITTENLTNVSKKNKDVLARILKAVKNIHEKSTSDKRPMILIKTKPASQPTSPKKSATTLKIQDLLNKMDLEEFENDGGEIMDEEEDEDEDDDSLGYRRTKAAHKKNRSGAYTSERESDKSSSASGVEKNPGNPFTIHKNKYRQNWLWNHFLDGDHMNINPSGPQFQSLGPSGPELFFGRKWWYFNQDDYKPMG